MAVSLVATSELNEDNIFPDQGVRAANSRDAMGRIAGRIGADSRTIGDINT
jgi:hypothetical protein